MRLRQAGWQTFYNPDASVTHLTGRSSLHDRRASLNAFHRSAYQYYRKHGGRGAALLAPLVFLALQARLALKLAARHSHLLLYA
jgi:GT2 family glycosyltransferase